MQKLRCWNQSLVVACWMTLIVTGEPICGEDSWPQWLGPRRDGVSRETDWNTDWPNETLPLKWSRAIGIGFSSLSIAGDRLLTMGHVDGEEVVWCLNRESGETIWTHRYPCELNDNLHEGGPGATPTVDGDRVYTLGKEGQLYCLNLETGKVVWEVMLKSDLEVPLPEWGFSSSPLILETQVIVEGGRLVAYDKFNGKKNWQTPTHEAGYGSAAPMIQPGEPVCLATLDCEGLRITNAENGKQVAFRSWPSPFRTNATTPIVVEQQIWISSAYNVGCGLFDFDQKRGQLTEVYTNKELRNHFNNSILWEDHVYGFDGNANFGRVVQLTCMNRETGDVAWKQRGLGCGSLLVVDGKLVILSENGVLVVAKATPDKFEELARAPVLTGRCWTVPAFVDKHVYCRNAAGDLVCVDLTSTR